MTLGSRAWYDFVRGLVKVTFFGSIGGLKTIHGERVPKDGPLIVAPNHLSVLDPPAIACAIQRRLNFMAKEELFRGIFGRLIASVGAFPVRRGEGDSEAIRRAMAMLESGRAVLIFPEGTRGDGESLLPLNRGVALMAKRTGAKVLPMGIVGTQRLLPKGSKKLKRGRITVVVGKPFTYEEATRDASGDPRIAFTHRLATDIVDLCREAGLDLRMPD
ncbi:MAG: lysophospholipid acyltransferase family protein [Fimbriimonadaceae bacterium]